MRDLKDCVALVTGATRGVGLGIATELGAGGATVYVTGRSTRIGATTDDLPGTVEDASAAVTEAGGRGIGVRCNHRSDAHVKELFEQINADQGRLDLLVNNVWGGYEGFDPSKYDQSFWEDDVANLDKMFVTGVRAHWVASSLAAPMMVEAGRGLIVTVSSGDRGKYRGDVVYDIMKTAANRLAFAMAQELKEFGVTSLAVQPGWTRTERIMRAYDDNPPPETESPRYTGRAVAALATDDDVFRHTGKVFRTGELAEMYDFTDVDGRRVPPFDLGEAYQAPKQPL